MNDLLSDSVAQYTDDLYKWAYFKTSSRETAEDLVQETFMAAVENILLFKRDSTPKTWLFGILNNKIADYYRKKVKQPLSIETNSFAAFFDGSDSWQRDKKPKNWHENEEHLLDNTEFQEVLKECLEALPEKWFICIRLKYLNGPNKVDVCQELDISPTNFWQITHRAKLQLRDCIEDKWL